MRRRTHLHILAVFIVLALAALWPAGAARAGHPAQQNGITLDVRVGFDGYAESGNWVPVTVTVSNNGEDLTGELRIEASPLTGGRTHYVRPIELPRGSRKQVTLYVADLSTFSQKVQVDLARRGRVVTSQQADVHLVSPTTLLVGVWSDSPGAVAGIGEVKPTSNETKVAFITADDLPPVARGWGALDVLVISDVDSGQLTPEQRTALRDWLAQGGRLIITGGLSFQRTLSGLGDVTPLLADNTTTVSVAPLGEAAGNPFDVQARLDAPVTTGTLTGDANVLVASGDVPLVISRQVGHGQVDFLTADPNLEPLRSWDALPALWRAILLGGRSRPGWAYGFNQNWDAARQAVASVPGVSLPSVLQLCGFLSVYVFLIGPVNYLVLWRMKRREWAWFTIPVLVLLFSAIAYVTGFQVRGTRIILHRLAVVQSWAGSETARVDSLVGIWSPRRARYDIEFEPGFLVRPVPRDYGGGFASIDGSQIEQGQVVTLRDIRVDVGAIQAFAVEGFTMEAPRLEGNLTVRPTDDGVRVTGDVLNSSDEDLHNVVLIFGGTVHRMDDLPAGKVLHIDEVMRGGSATPSVGGLDPFPADSSMYGYGLPYYYGYGYTSLLNDIMGEETCYSYYDPGEGADRRQCNLVSGVLNSDARGSGVYLLGWSDRAPLHTQVLGVGADEVDITLYIVELDTTLGSPTGQSLRIPPGLMTWRIVDQSQNMYVNGPYDIYMSQGDSVVFHFEPMALISDMAVESFIVHLEAAYGTSDPPRVEVWNLITGRWDLLRITRWGDTRVDDAEAYVDSRGGIDLRIRATELYGMSISRIAVTLLTR